MGRCVSTPAPTARRLSLPDAGRAAAMLFAVLGALACGGGDKAPTNVTPPDTTTGGPTKPNPLTVRVTTDPAHAVTQRVRAQTGGTLRATAADGSRFTLTILPGALAADTTITMAPIARVDDLPFDGLLAGVDLAPEGLRFFTAMLTVEPAKSFNPEGINGAGYQGSGAEFHFVPIAVQGTTITLPLTHFSGKMIVISTPQQRAQQQRRAPTRPADAVDQLLADPQQLLDALVRALQESYIAVAAELEAAKADEQQIPLGVLALWEWLQQVGARGLDSRLQPEIANARVRLAEALTNARGKALARCTDFLNPDEVTDLQFYLAVANIFGVTSVQDALRRAVTQCRPAKIKVTLDMNVTEQLGPDNAAFRVTVAGKAEGYLMPEASGDLLNRYDAPLGSLAPGIAFTYSDFKINDNTKQECHFVAVDKQDGFLSAFLHLDPDSQEKKPHWFLQPGSPPPLERQRQVGADYCASSPILATYWSDLFTKRVTDGFRDPNEQAFRFFLDWPGSNGVRTKTFAGKSSLLIGPGDTGASIGYIDGTLTITLQAEFNKTP